MERGCSTDSPDYGASDASKWNYGFADLDKVSSAGPNPAEQLFGKTVNQFGEILQQICHGPVSRIGLAAPWDGGW
jgi:hypothetical protein